MTTTYTWDIFTTLDGFGSYREPGDWGGYWGKQGPELLEHRRSLFDADQRMVFGATTYREYVAMFGSDEVDPEGLDAWVTRMRALPLTVISSTLADPLDWTEPGLATVAAGDAVDVVARLKGTSAVPLRSHGSLALNRALLVAGLVDRIQVTLFPVINGRTGTGPVLAGADDFDLELLEARTLDGHTQELTYRPTLRTWS